MPYKNEEKRKAYFKEYYSKKKVVKLNKFNSPTISIKPVDSWSTKTYEGPPIAETEDMEDIVSGMTQAELNESAQDIQDALEPIELPEKYQHLPDSSIREISRGISPLIYGIDSKESYEIDPVTFEAKPKEPEDDPEVWVWPVRV